MRNLRTGNARRNERGFTLVELLIGIVLAAIVTIVALNAVQGQRAESEMNQGVSFIASDVPTALSSYFIGNARTYTGLPTGTTASTYMNQRFGLNQDMPWVPNSVAGPAWQFTGVTATSVTAQFSCMNMRTATACQTVASNLLALNTSMIGTATTAAVASTAGCPSTGSTCQVTVAYGVPK